MLHTRTFHLRWAQLPTQKKGNACWNIGFILTENYLLDFNNDISLYMYILYNRLNIVEYTYPHKVIERKGYFPL